MTFKQVTAAIYALYLTNKYGVKLKNKTADEEKKIRLEYASTLLDFLKISIKVINPEKIPVNGQYLLISNHRTIIDPTIIDIALQQSTILGHWVAKKELYNSPFFGAIVRNSHSINLDRESKHMAPFFSQVKASLKQNASIFVFPEGTRNQTDQHLIEFKDGSQIIAVKNRLSILPVYIKGRADLTLKDAIKYRHTQQTIEIEIGDLIDRKDRSQSLEEHYKSRFSL